MRTSSVWLRWPAGIALLAGGLLGFLPVLGYWMIPLGLILIVQDIPLMRAPMARLLAYVRRKWA